MGTSKDIMIAEQEAWHDIMVDVFEETDGLIEFVDKADEYRHMGMRCGVHMYDYEVGRDEDEVYDEFLEELYSHFEVESYAEAVADSDLIISDE